MQSEYQSLMESAKTLEKAKRELTVEEGAYVSPAWRMLYHAQAHVTKLAEEVLRKEEVRA